jgi:IS5 family transposase
MYLLQSWFTLSDEGVEDAIYDSYAFRKFMRIDFMEAEQVPDTTTLCKFWKLLNDNGITKLFFDAMKAFLDRHGKLARRNISVSLTVLPSWNRPSLFLTGISIFP